MIQSRTLPPFRTFTQLYSIYAVILLFEEVSVISGVVAWLSSDIKLPEKCFSFTDASFTTINLYTNAKPNLSNVVIFILIEQNESYVIR